MTSHEIVPLTHFTSDGRELQHVYCLVEHRGVVGDIDKHGDLSLSDSLPFPDEVVLEESGQLALSEWYNMLLSSPAGENTRYLCVWGIGKEREERGRREEGKEREKGNERPPILVVSHGLDAFPQGEE